MATGYACCGGVALVSDLSDLSDLSDKMSAPVFALTGYAVASHVIPGECCAAVWNDTSKDLPLRYAVTTAARLEKPAAAPGVVRGTAGLLATA